MNKFNLKYGFLYKDNSSTFRLYILTLSILFLFFLLPNHARSIEATDPHYTEAGFFDIHVCNWPGRPLFFMALVSTTKFNDISSIDIYLPSNEKLGSLNLAKFRLTKDKKNKEKRVFISQFEIPSDAQDGWYYTKINLKNGKSILSKDYVVLEKLALASITTPDIRKKLNDVPSTFKWKPILGAQYYQVFFKDVWESKLIFSSKLLSNAEVKLPKGLLEKGGVYTIQIHARDVNEHLLLGDFNHGSLTKKFEFSISE